MIRAIVFAAIGFWVSRKIYENIDLQKQQEHKQLIKQRLSSHLKKIGLNKKEIDQAIQKVIPRDEQ